MKLQGILAGICVIFREEILASFPDFPKGFVQIHAALGNIRHASGDVGAMVGSSLQIRQQIRPYESGGGGAVSLL